MSRTAGQALLSDLADPSAIIGQAIEYTDSSGRSDGSPGWDAGEQQYNWDREANKLLALDMELLDR